MGVLEGEEMAAAALSALLQGSVLPAGFPTEGIFYW